MEVIPFLRSDHNGKKNTNTKKIQKKTPPHAQNHGRLNNTLLSDK